MTGIDWSFNKLKFCLSPHNELTHSAAAGKIQGHVQNLDIPNSEGPKRRDITEWPSLGALENMSLRFLLSEVPLLQSCPVNGQSKHVFSVQNLAVSLTGWGGRFPSDRMLRLSRPHNCASCHQFLLDGRQSHLPSGFCTILHSLSDEFAQAGPAQGCLILPAHFSSSAHSQAACRGPDQLPVILRGKTSPFQPSL